MEPCQKCNHLTPQYRVLEGGSIQLAKATGDARSLELFRHTTGNPYRKYRLDRIVALLTTVLCFIGKEGGMRRGDLMKPDLLSEILLLGSGVLIFVTLILIAVAALLRTPSLP